MYNIKLLQLLFTRESRAAFRKHIIVPWGGYSRSSITVYDKYLGTMAMRDVF